MELNSCTMKQKWDKLNKNKYLISFFILANNDKNLKFITASNIEQDNLLEKAVGDILHNIQP